jgi:hypothetical protein
MSSCTVEQKTERLVAQTMALFEQNQAALIDFVGSYPRPLRVGSSADTASRKGSSKSRMTSMSASGAGNEIITASRSPATSSSISAFVCVSRNLTTRSGWRRCKSCSNLGSK